jgi:hypothetical protein
VIKREPDLPSDVWIWLRCGLLGDLPVDVAQELWPNIRGKPKQWDANLVKYTYILNQKRKFYCSEVWGACDMRCCVICGWSLCTLLGHAYQNRVHGFNCIQGCLGGMRPGAAMNFHAVWAEHLIWSSTPPPPPHAVQTKAFLGATKKGEDGTTVDVPLADQLASLSARDRMFDSWCRMIERTGHDRSKTATTYIRDYNDKKTP